MGLLQKGNWVDQWYETESTEGKFVRESSQFKQWIRKDGSTPFTPEKERYHLYVSLACPWAHRTLIFRKIKKLEDVISVSVVNPIMKKNGWKFGKDGTDDSVNGKDFLYQVYVKANPTYSGRVSVPVLWDKKTKTIVNNESSEIIRMFNEEFSAFTDIQDDFYPLKLRKQIDEINTFVYNNVNNGVYKAGFATSQEAYEEAFASLFDALDSLEKTLNQNTFLIKDQITEADWRLFTTLIRFDPVYVGHFKCNKKRIADYPQLSKYLKTLYNIKGVKETVSFDHIKKHYYSSHDMINPSGIVPLGPKMYLDS